MQTTLGVKHCQLLQYPGLNYNSVMGYGTWVILRMIIPRTGNLHETLFILAHDVLGHFEFDKTYRSLCNAYYWPNMRRDLEQGYAVATRIGLQ